ncbi:MAG: hypothetical protein H3Z49_05090 [archaeon]|nr:hypothetical protein [archaeon]
MLSKTEREFLIGKAVSYGHKRKLIHTIRKKVKTFFMLELPLIQNSPYDKIVTEISNNVTKNSN